MALYRVIPHQFLQRQCAVIRNIAAIHKYAVILKHLLYAIIAVVIEIFKTFVVFVMP